MDLHLLHLMEDFVLKEVEYSQQYGYSGRAKRYMRRKLTNNLMPFLEKIESQSESEYDSDSDYDPDAESKHEKNEVDDNNNDANNDANAPYEDKDDEITFNKIIKSDRKLFHSVDLCFGTIYIMIICIFYYSIAYLIVSYSNMYSQIEKEKLSKSCL